MSAIEGQDAAIETYQSQFIHGLYYHHDARDGMEAIGAVVHNHKIKMKVLHGERKELYIIYDVNHTLSGCCITVCFFYKLYQP